ncbi:noncanonical pyrimidine nucleotidase, YjjG family [Chryseobacterium sp. SNU WT5]|uniref:YjjG family noncanonical pyrimidine nucleotidase n=1 Tax=Chryseobacterium sp. SNU WT5 TaxID=2594269 RepID=UPI00117F5A00|nr:YjjG family noncanonical pyrimidine nucleotidase [Chryseobacterium sp. SNU WT5]QDP85037.1 noncanonical pyrimidine nucleotidase, YjjG family [Chryseobacterium sp. SNU WT5]
MKIQHIFFDLDNTLWDHRGNAHSTLQEIFKRENVHQKYNLDFEDFHREYFTINERLWEQIRDGEIDKDYLRKHRFYDSFLFFGIDDFELAQTFESNFLDEILNYNDLVEGAFEVLEYLHDQGYKMHILSNGFKEVTHRKCELSGIQNYFQTITSADEIDIRKPHPQIYDYALNKANAKPGESMMIGDDWIADVEGGKSFGLEVIFYDAFNDNFKADGVKVIKKLIELKELL